MLGKRILDPFEMETRQGEIGGLGLLDVTTTLLKEKMTFQVKAAPLNGLEEGEGEILSGYEIHMGETERGPSTAPAFRILARLERETAVEDGAVDSDRRVWGTYLHGLFENNGFRRRFSNPCWNGRTG